MTKPATFSGTKLAAAREKAGLTRAELAKAVGISRQTIISIESGKHGTSFELACLLADALGVKVDSFRGIRNE